MTTVLDTLEKGTAYLEQKGIENARRNMQLLVTHQIGCSKVELYMQFDRTMSEAELTPIREKLKRRAKGEPLQHLLGTVEFYRREFKTDSRALIPRPETEELASLIIKEISTLQGSLDILDMGTGSGVLGLTLSAELSETYNNLTLADISSDALALASENTTLLGLGQVKLVESDLFSTLGERKYHIIAANLPYIAESSRASLSPEVQHDPAIALFGGKSGLDILRQFILQAPLHLYPGGIVALEIGYNQSDNVEAILKESGFQDITTHKDLNGIPRFPIARIL